MDGAAWHMTQHCWEKIKAGKHEENPCTFLFQMLLHASTRDFPFCFLVATLFPSSSYALYYFLPPLNSTVSFVPSIQNGKVM